MAFNMALSWKCPQNVPTFHVSLYFFHLLFSKKHLVVIVFCHVLSCFCAGWAVAAVTFFNRRVPDISHTPRIIFPWWQSHRMAFNMALSWTQNVPTFHFFPSISSIFFSARSIWLRLFFSCFVLFLCWLGGCGSYFFIRGVPDISHTPRIISSLVEIPQNGI